MGFFDRLQIFLADPIVYRNSGGPILHAGGRRQNRAGVIRYLLCVITQEIAPCRIHERFIAIAAAEELADCGLQIAKSRQCRDQIPEMLAITNACGQAGPCGLALGQQTIKSG